MRSQFASQQVHSKFATTPSGLIASFSTLNSQPVKIIRPDYPALARQTKTQGRVSLKCVIDINGSVEQIEVKKGHPLLIQASVEAVSKWKFKPPSFNGKAVRTDAIIDIDFQLVAEQKDGDSSQP